MKINSVLGKMNGKVGNIVISTVGGEVIGREYNPNVSNPNTQSQQGGRSKFKLVSQLSATMAPVIAIKKEGNVSARNQFIKKNYGSVRYGTGTADINLNVVQLTKSNIAFAGFKADRTAGTAIAVELNADSAAALSRVVYIGYRKLDDGTLQLFDSKTCSVAGADGKFADSLQMQDGAVVLYAYGIKDMNSGITSKFGDMVAPTAEDVAQLLVTNTENMSSVQLTKTAGLTMAAGENTGDSDDVEHLTVSVVTSGNGSATGGGRFEAGQTVTLRATPDAEAEFDGWHLNNASGQLLSTANPYTFQVEQNITICAKFHGGPTPHYNIAVSADPQNGGTVSGGGSKEEGSSCTVVATPAEGMMFDGWFENGSLVSNQASYTFTVDRARTLVAQFAEAPEGLILSIKVNGTDINNKQYVDSNANYVGAFDATANGKLFGASAESSAPTIGQQIRTVDKQTISNGAASLTGLNDVGDGLRMYFFVGSDEGDTIAVEEVFPVSLALSD